MKLERTGPQAFALTLAAQELAALFAGVRMALDTMHGDPRTSPEAIRVLERIVGDYDRALRRVDGHGRT